MPIDPLEATDPLMQDEEGPKDVVVETPRRGVSRFIQLRPIGVVHSSVATSEQIPRQGVKATIEVFPEFTPGLLGIERSSHIMIVGWLNQAERNILQVHRPRYVEAEVKRGVFACRTPVRPNPLGSTTVKLMSLDGGVLHVQGLDMADGTPVLDIKPHAPGFDAAFCARSARDLSRLADPDAGHALLSMVREAENFHGERCVGLVLGAKMIYKVMKSFGIAQKDAALTISVGEDHGCIADAVQALTGATFGNGRLKSAPGYDFAFCFDGRKSAFRPSRPVDMDIEAALRADLEQLIEIVQM